MTARARFLSHRGARFGSLFVAALIVVAAGADLIASDLPLAVRVDGRFHLLPCLTHPAALADEDQQSLGARATLLWRTPIPFSPNRSRSGNVQEPLAPPSLRNLAGTDDRGRDVAARLVHGTRTALFVGVLAVALSLLLGVAVGTACGLGRRTDRVLGRVIEVGLTFPSFLVLLAIQGAWGAPSSWEVAIAIALTRWPDVARLSRDGALKAAASSHFEAARALGAGWLRLVRAHLLPFAAVPAITAAAFGLGQAVLTEAALAFLGFGVPPPTPTWGELLSQAQAAGLVGWLLVPPTLAIALTVLSCNGIADGLRAVFDRSAND